jgi:transcriptional regulator with XRE-family HTH domain
MLAGVSIDYYTRLEQGREANPSPQVVAALSRALELTVHETNYLHTLCGMLWDPPASSQPPPDATLLRMMESWEGSAAFIIDPLLDITAMNSLAQSLFSPFFSTRNLIEMVFLDDAGKSFYVDWNRAAESCVAALRMTERFASDASRREELISGLRAGSAHFEELWQRYDVHPKTQDQKTLFHPATGEITIDFHTFGVASMPGSELVVYQAEPGSRSERRLRALATSPSEELIA